MSCIDNTVNVVNSKVDKSNENLLVLVSGSKAMNTSISAMQESLHTSNTMTYSIKQDLHAVLPRKGRYSRPDDSHSANHGFGSNRLGKDRTTVQLTGGQTRSALRDVQCPGQSKR